MSETEHQERIAPGSLTRRSLLRSAGAAAGLLALGGPRALAATGPTVPTLASAAVPPNGPLREFHSTDIAPPTAHVTGTGTATGYAFVGPEPAGAALSGPLIVDQAGQPVWFHPIQSGHWVTNLRANSYRGAPALSWWQGKVIPPGFGQGQGVVVDSSYRTVAKIRAGNGRTIDLHELLLTPQHTALFTCHPPIVTADLSSVGGPRNGQVYESIIQEVDVGTGRLLSEWRSLDHIPVSDSNLPLGEPYDYLHINSIDIAPDGNLLVSARHTWALYKLDRRTGRVIWRLGGKRSDFQVGNQAHFSWQHHAQFVDGEAITLFDNGSDGYTTTEQHSRALLLDVDTHRRTARLQRSYVRPHPVIAYAMGSAQQVADDHVVVGWGDRPIVSEFAANGTLLSELRLASGRQSYRGFRSEWAGTPVEPPALASSRDPLIGDLTLYVSWNGATAVDSWLISAGSRSNQLRPIGVAARQGLETAIAAGNVAGGFVTATALDPSGAHLATSHPTRV